MTHHTDTTTSTTTDLRYRAGDAVILQPNAPVARLGIAGAPARGVVEFLVRDTAPHPTRGPLYHIRLTTPGASGWLGLGVARAYADELTRDPEATSDATPPTLDAAPDAASDAAPEVAPHDGEHLGVLIFDTRADHLAQSSGLWVYPACDADLRACMRRAEHLSATFDVTFFALHIYPAYLDATTQGGGGGGASPAIDCPGYYAATTAENTRRLRRVVTRGLERARAMAPRATADESET